MTFLALTNVRKVFPNATTPAVDDFNLSVQRGEFVSFLGPSGCGKTTTLRMVAGFEHPTAGAITIDGRDITGVRPNQRNIGMVFQSYALFPNMTVADNIGFGLKVKGASKAEIKQRVAEMLSLIKLEQLGGRYPYQLSGGQQQRVALARALAIRPQLLLLDEPLSALDAKIRVSLRNEIRAIQRQLGITTIYVTHDQEEALSLSDRVVVMNAGVIEQIGAPFEVYNFPKTAFVASFVGTLNIFEARVSDPAAGVLQLSAATILVSPSHLSGRRAGEAVKVAMRPEMIHVKSTGAADENRLTGVVENVAFLGAVARIHLRVGEMTVLVDEFNNPHLAVPAVGSALTCYFAREGCIVLA
ncbi:MAG TPA: Fe3+/spermidine/putrescine ABC transporter ATP-binding protein [Chloroflexi bacterium]|nr:Fe3+/spermidine/putrescine ABC transporter ATP-binding protein [Chloroflexota bacterium]HHW86573.1 ABC transporter ATP-binding protein [Chloroflexota bacterium]